MAVFNQQGQTVGYQVNGETFHFDSTRSVPAAVSELEKLLAALDTTGVSSAADMDAVQRATAKVAEAVAAGKVPCPEKSDVAGCLSEAARLLRSVSSLSGLAGAVASAASMAWRVF